MWASLGKSLTGVLILVSGCALLVACRSTQDPVWNRPQCDSAQEERAGRLQDGRALKDVPGGVERSKDFRVVPCEDEDGIGTVGWNGMLGKASEVAIRDHYKLMLPQLGWSLKNEAAPATLASGQLDDGRPQLCFESELERGAILVVYIEPASRERQLFVEVRFAAKRMIACVDYFS